MGRLVTTARGGGGYWGSSRSCSACASRASRACEECLKNGPSNSPTTRERTNQAARPIATHHHAFSPASPRVDGTPKAGRLLSAYGTLHDESATPSTDGARVMAKSHTDLHPGDAILNSAKGPSA